MCEQSINQTLTVSRFYVSNALAGRLSAIICQSFLSLLIDHRELIGGTHARWGNINILYVLKRTYNCVSKNWMSLTISCARVSSVHLFKPVRYWININKLPSDIWKRARSLPRHPTMSTLIVNNLFSMCLCKIWQLILFYEFIAASIKIQFW